MCRKNRDLYEFRPMTWKKYKLNSNSPLLSTKRKVRCSTTQGGKGLYIGKVVEYLEGDIMVVVKGYKLGEALGEGAFATCRLGHKESDPKCTVAVKSLMRNHPNFDEDSLRKEIHIMQAIKHPRCIALFEVVEDSAAVHLVEELASGGELFDRIIELGHFSESQAVKLIHQVFDGIQYLHTNGMIHRDLKPENLLMVSRDPNSEEFMQLKIADFGLSAQRTEAKSAEEWQKMLQDFCGTQDYLAPEVFTLAATRNKDGQHYTGKVDVWAAGVIYYIMLCGYPPFWMENDDMMSMIQQITTASFAFHSPAWDEVSEDSKGFIRKCLTVEVEHRPTSIECMNDPLFKNDRLPSTHLGPALDKLAKYKARFQVKATLKTINAISKMSLASHFQQDPNDPRQKEALNLFLSIDSMGDRNGQLELFEILLYMQHNYQHLFAHKDIDGENIVDEEKLKNFATFLRDSIDQNRDGVITKQEFIRGYCIWQMHMAKMVDQASKLVKAAVVYD